MPLNQCTACGADFVSLRSFDQHVLSKPSDPDFDCLTIAEMQRQGWTQNALRRWSSPQSQASADTLREHFSAVCKPVEADLQRVEVYADDETQLLRHIEGGKAGRYLKGGNNGRC
jgi:hypothetical protein